METKPAIVVVLRRDPETFTLAERTAYEGCFPERKVEFVRTDPTDYIQHDRICQELGAEMVVLPLDRPLPTLAMQRGVPHVVVKDSTVQELQAMQTPFKPFEVKG